jgi:hypothetical protein
LDRRGGQAELAEAMSLMTAAPIPSSVGRFSPLGPQGILVLDLVNGISGFAKSNQHSLWRGGYFLRHFS